jgi:glucose-1-phosphate thymidylyltransferase
MSRKGIILAGGSGTRLYPATLVISKQLLPVFDKPMIYYPLSTLMLANIREILVISTSRDTPRFCDLLGNGSQWGLEIEYAVQASPDGLAQALIIAESFLDNQASALVLGDNIFYGHTFPELLASANSRTNGATIFAYHTQDLKRYGVVELNNLDQVISLEEKPENPKSNFAVTGLYFYDNKAVEYAKQVKPSLRGELEITDLNLKYLADNKLSVEVMGRGYTWLDAGTHEDLLEAHQFIRTVELRQGLKIACPEEIGYRNKWITSKQVKSLAKTMKNNAYREYLMRMMEEIY